jgi:4-hydroxybenzoate polyprenyltransferase
MRSTIIAYLQLVRLPNVVTAAADSLAAWLLVTGSVSHPERWLPLAGASMVLYAAGIALNDVFDYDIDRIERPGRPLPSGRVLKKSAARLGAIGLVIGPILACSSGSLTSGIVAATLAVCILAYDAGLKHTWLGPAAMGSCRGINLLIGASHAPAVGGPIVWFAATAYGLYVAGITVVSRSETSGGARGGLITGLGLQDVAVLCLAVVALSHQRFPQPDLDRSLIPLEGLLILALTALAVNTTAASAIAQPMPQLIQKAVKTSILSLVWLHVGVVAAVRGLQSAGAIALCWLAAFIMGRWLYST